MALSISTELSILLRSAEKFPTMDSVFCFGCRHGVRKVLYMSLSLASVRDVTLKTCFLFVFTSAKWVDELHDLSLDAWFSKRYTFSFIPVFYFKL